MKRRHGAVGMVAILVAATTAALWMGCKKSGSDAVAVVDGKEITKDDVYHEVPAPERDQALFQLVLAQLVEKEAQKAGITVTDEDVQREVEMRLGSMEAFQEHCRRSGLDPAAELARARTGLIVLALSTKDVQLTEDDIKASFAQTKESYREPTTFNLREIRAQGRPAIEEVQRELKGGADFQQLVMERSLNATNNGDWGTATLEDLKSVPFPSLRPDAMAAKKGDLLGPYGWPETPEAHDQWSLLRVEDRQDGPEPSLDDPRTRASVERSLKAESPAAVELAEFQRRLLAEAKIEVLSPDFQTFEQLVTSASSPEAGPGGEAPAPGAPAPGAAAGAGN